MMGWHILVLYRRLVLPHVESNSIRQSRDLFTHPILCGDLKNCAVNDFVKLHIGSQPVLVRYIARWDRTLGAFKSGDIFTLAQTVKNPDKECASSKVSSMRAVIVD